MRKISNAYAFRIIRLTPMGTKGGIEDDKEEDR